MEFDLVRSASGRSLLRLRRLQGIMQSNDKITAHLKK
jgi:hypothetical protein